ncbi:MAG: ABC transporter permease [Actinomycetota bacterium]|nr:ABC transporter permease [Actinomycetota bacterium]
MTRYLLRRVVLLLVTLAAASVIVFVVLAILPGKPAEVILGTQATPSAVRALTDKLGLDKPIWRQYVDWVGGIVSGHLGTSYISGQPIASELGSALEVTGPLVGLGLLVGLVVAVPLGVFSAVRSRRASGVAASVLNQIGIAVPSFVLGILLIVVVGVELHLLPTGGFTGWSDPTGALRSLVLPAVALGVVEGAIVGRYVRTAVLDVLSSDYLRTARAKGLTPGRALVRHGLRNVAVPVLTVLGLELAGLVVGAVIIENVFTLPGMGTLLLQSVENRDLIVVEDIVLLVAAVVLVVNFAVDILYHSLDPRIARER